MATCSVQTLLDDSPCFATLAGPGQWESVKLALLCQILQALDPMATCDVQTLLTAGKCFYPAVSEGMGQTLELQLLCEISAAVGGGGGAGILFTEGVGAPPVDGSILTQGYFDTSGPIKWINIDWPDIANPDWQQF